MYEWISIYMSNSKIVCFFSYNENTRLKGSGTLRDFSSRGRRRRKNDVAEKKTSGWWVMERECAKYFLHGESMSQLRAINAYDDLLFWIHSWHISLLAFVQVCIFATNKYSISLVWLLGSWLV